MKWDVVGFLEDNLSVCIYREIITLNMNKLCNYFREKDITIYHTCNTFNLEDHLGSDA